MSDQKPKATGTKFSEFGMTMTGPIDVVGLKDGQNVRATLTTDLVETNPGEAFRDAKGRFRSTADYEELTNQLKVNRFIANELDLINGAIASLQAGSVVVQDDPPNIEEDGQLWLDSNRLELFISYDGAWISTTPLAARVEQGEAVQAAIIEALDEGIREQTRIRSRVGDLEANSATKQYVNDQIAGIDFPEAVAFERPMLWKYNPGVSANNLGNGEFNLSSGPTNGAAGEWSIYFAKRDANGQYWYPHDNGNAYTHTISEQLATIRGREQVSAHGKTQQWLFNQGTNKYAQLKLTYYRSSNPLGAGKYHLITIPGYMPFFTFGTDAQSNGTHS